MSVNYDAISTRDAFGEALLGMARQMDTIVAIGADTTKSMGFKGMMEEFPGRVVNIGIAEQNMALMAAGAASCGAKAVIATYAPFASLRICEQIRTFICYPNLDVKIISGLGGLSGNIEGVTHQGLEDLGVVRCLANLVVAVPADAASTVVIAKELLAHYGPAYLRIGRGPVETVFDQSYTFEIGKANVLRTYGTDAALFCNGAAVARTLRAAALLEAKGILTRVIEMPCLKPLDTACVAAAARECGVIFCVEEHSVIGGLGSAVCESVCADTPCKVVRIGIDDMYTEAAPHDQLLDKYNLHPSHIAGVVEAHL